MEMAQKMLLKQLQCQTPDDTFDPNTMMSTMMSMLTIAQQSQLVDTQKQSMEMQKALFYTSLSSFEGEYIEHSGDIFEYNNEAIDNVQEIVYNLPAKTNSAVLRIFDTAGNIVQEVDLDTIAGRGKYVWDGKMKNGQDAKNDIYTTSITATDENHKPIIMPMRLKSKITEIAYDDKELAVPYSGRIPIYDIKRRTMINQATQHYQRNTEQNTITNISADAISPAIVTPADTIVQQTL